MDSQINTQDTDKLIPVTKKSLRGFAAMDPQRQREIASLGGRAAHQSGHAHEFTSEEARAAGKKRHARASAHSTPTRIGIRRSPTHWVLRCVRIRLRTSSPSTHWASAGVPTAGGVSSFMGWSLNRARRNPPTRVWVPSYTSLRTRRRDSAVALTE